MSLLFYRILKWTGIVVLSLVALLAVFFSIFVMNPFEGRLDDLDAIVPSELNLYAAKAVSEGDARSVFDTPFWKELTDTRAFQMWVRSPEWRRSGAYADLRRMLARLDLVQVTYDIDPIAEIAGREVGIGLRWRSPGAPPDFLLLTRLGFLAKASLAAMQRDMWRSLTGAPVEPASNPDVLRLRVPNGAGDDVYFLGRVRDVLLVSSDEALITRSLGLAAGEGKTLGDRLGERPTAADEPIGVLLSPEPGRLSNAWSSAVVPKDVGEVERLFARIADPIGLERLRGRVHLAKSPHVALSAAFQPGSLSRMQDALRESTVEDLPQTLAPFLEVAPRDLLAVVYAHVRPRKLGRFIEDTLDADVQELVRDTLQPTALRTLPGLLDRWTGSLDTGMCIFLNRQSFSETTTNPPHPGVTLVFRMTDTELWTKTIHHDLWDQLRNPLSLDPPTYESPRADVEMMFYRSRSNPYADISTPAFARFGDLLAFSTCADFLRAMADVYLEPSRYGLDRTGEIDRLFSGPHPLDRNASLFAFLDVRRSLVWVDDMAPYWASAAALATQLDNAESKRRSLEYQARGLTRLKTNEAREKWIDEQMRVWSKRLEAELSRRTSEALGPFIEHLGVLHQVGFTVGPGEAANGLRVKATCRFDP